MRSIKPISLVAIGLTLTGLGAAARLPLLQLAHTKHPHTGQPITVPGKDQNSTLLFNGWKITPAGRHIPTGDFLLGGTISPDGKTLAITNAGFDKHALHLVDLATEKEIGNFPLAHAWNGIAWSSDCKTLYVSGGVSIAGNDVFVFENSGNKWVQTKALKLAGNDPKNTVVAGLALSTDNKTLFVANNSDNRLYVLDTASGDTKATIEVGDHPYAMMLNPENNILAVTLIGGKSVVALNVNDPAKPEIVVKLESGGHPNAIAASKDGRAFVTCANSDLVYVYDTEDGKLSEIIHTSLSNDKVLGNTPVSVAVAPDSKTLYVANADTNNVAVIDISKAGSSKVMGFIPTGWYPTCVNVTPDGKRVIIGTGKGIGAQPNPGTVKPENPVAPANYKFEYIGKQLNGLISFVDAPNEAKLADYTRQVMANTPGRILKAAQLTEKTAVPTKVGDPSPIKHILYIIKENRTYDQVFGDMKQGNGDPGLTLFGRDVTPNHHALAEQFVLLDNLYCNGEVSVDGHQWCDAAIVTDFEQKAWVYSYSGKGHLNESDSVSEPESGYLWDACKKKGLTYRSYGENFHASSSEAAPEPVEAATTSLKGHGSPKFVGVGWPKGQEFRDTDKADIFLAEWKEFERTNTIPNFMVMSLGEDHTRGTAPNSHTPKACVASNDVAVGKIVEGITHSAAWKDTAIFIIEDDAQNGPDHIDSHRTVGLVISPYTKRGVVDSTMYSTASMIRTMELFLGLPPLTQYDAAATPMFGSFMAKADLKPYTLLPAKIDLTAKNGKTAFGALRSSKMDFTAYDRAPERELNEILWHSIKGKDVPMPAAARSYWGTSTYSFTPVAKATGLTATKRDD